jgi:hypothetical protein
MKVLLASFEPRRHRNPDRPTLRRTPTRTGEPQTVMETTDKDPRTLRAHAQRTRQHPSGIPEGALHSDSGAAFVKDSTVMVADHDVTRSGPVVEPFNPGGRARHSYCLVAARARHRAPVGRRYFERPAVLPEVVRGEAAAQSVVQACADLTAEVAGNSSRIARRNIGSHGCSS